MPILNYTTTVDAFQSASEIEYILMQHGAKSVLKEFENGKLANISFLIERYEKLIPIKLPARVNQCLQVLIKEKKNNPKKRIVATYDQAEKVAWRILKDWVEAQMAMLDVDMAKMEEIFLPYITCNAGQSLFEKIEKEQFMLEG